MGMRAPRGPGALWKVGALWEVRGSAAGWRPERREAKARWLRPTGGYYSHMYKAVFYGPQTNQKVIWATMLSAFVCTLV